MATYSIRIHPERVRTIPDPSFPGMKTLYALVDVHDLPSTQTDDGQRRLQLGLGPDPRIPRPRSAMMKQISESLETWDGTFHLLNRGITISAQSADYDNHTKLLSLIVPEDDDRYGILDGGHTNQAIETALQKEPSDPDSLRDQFVRLEILIGAEEYLVEIARARNTSQAVKPFSLNNKQGAFQWLKEAISPFDTKIRWSENDPQEFPVLELIQILAACNPTQFKFNDHPIEAYKNSGKCLDYLLDAQDKYGYKRLRPVAKDIWRLYDTIRFKWWSFYNQPHPVTGKLGRAGRTQEVLGRKRGRTGLMHYIALNKKGNPAAGDKHVEKGLAFPVLAGFRALLEQGPDENIRWKVDPFEFFDKHGVLLVRTVMDASDSRDNNPHIVGRDSTVYDLVYRTIESELTKVENEQLRAQLAQHEAARV